MSMTSGEVAFGCYFQNDHTHQKVTVLWVEEVPDGVDRHRRVVVYTGEGKTEEERWELNDFSKHHSPAE